MTITVGYRTADGQRGRRSYKTLKGARRFAHERVGKHPEEGQGEAASLDGLCVVSWSGCSFSELFPPRDLEERASKMAAIREHILGVLAEGPKTFWCLSPARASRADVQDAWHSLQGEGRIECRHTAQCFGGEEPLWQLAVPLEGRRYEGEDGDTLTLQEAIALALPEEEPQLRRMDVGTAVFAGGEQIKRIK